MFYYEFKADTPYCGTEHTEYHEFEVRPSEAELEEMCDEICYNNANGYEYLINGWDGDDPSEEELDNYYADCYGAWREISKEEYEENT